MTAKVGTTRPELTIADMNVAPGHLIRRLQQIAVAIFLEEFQALKMTPVQYAALIAIKDRPNIDQRTLGSLIAIDRTTLGTLLRRLEERGLVTRITPKHNQRIKQLTVTPAGLTLLQSTAELSDKVQARILAPLEGRQREEFMEHLIRLVSSNNLLSRAPLRVVGDEE